MKKLLLLLLTFSSSLLTSLNAQWVAQTAPSGTGDLYSVFAIDTNNVGTAGFQVGPITTDGGTNWLSNFSATGADFTTVHTGNTTHFYMMSSNSTFFIDIQLPSSISIFGGKPTSILALHFYTPGCAVAVGDTGYIQTTCDTGRTWTYASSGVHGNLNSVWFAGGTTGCACGDVGTIIRTKNGGATWSNIITATTSNLKGITFPTALVGYICGNNGAFLKSTDTGRTWISIPTGVHNNLNGVYFVNADTGYVVGTGGLIMRTTNGGTSWNAMVSGTSYVLRSVYFPTPTCGWAVGDSATILKYEGTVTTGLSSKITEDDIKTYPNPSNGNFTVEVKSDELRANSENTTFEIFDITGRQVASFNLPPSPLGGQRCTTNINASNLVNGIYYWEALSGGEVVGKGKIAIVK